MESDLIRVDRARQLRAEVVDSVPFPSAFFLTNFLLPLNDARKKGVRYQYGDMGRGKSRAPFSSLFFPVLLQNFPDNPARARARVPGILVNPYNFGAYSS